RPKKSSGTFLVRKASGKTRLRNAKSVSGSLTWMSPRIRSATMHLHTLPGNRLAVLRKDLKMASDRFGGVSAFSSRLEHHRVGVHRVRDGLLAGCLFVLDGSRDVLSLQSDSPP